MITRPYYYTVYNCKLETKPEQSWKTGQTSVSDNLRIFPGHAAKKWMSQ